MWKSPGFKFSIALYKLKHPVAFSICINCAIFVITQFRGGLIIIIIIIIIINNN